VSKSACKYAGGEATECSGLTAVVRSSARATHHRDEAMSKDYEILQGLFNRVTSFTVPSFVCSSVYAWFVICTHLCVFVRGPFR